ncbi:MAG TPA: glutamine--fructose-6-phosphate transaminase (isomerizing) [Solirubrobacteraceae bacterium]|nr:glutamine--fructose-6-phosphate transaminase (isomerizing) [Solirubrobacteraceae bacterium]
MCGIIGYVGRRPCREILLTGLKRLEYRGYDSAGIALQRDGQIEAVRAVGNLSALERALAAHASAHASMRNGNGVVATVLAEPTTGIGHTRWATHGRVTEDNAHPHEDTDGRVHIVLNGIIENHLALRERLTSYGAQFRSDTDAEVVAHLIAHLYDGDLVAAVQASLPELSGHFAFVAMSAEHPDLLVGTRRECPLVVGVAEDEQFLASAIPAFLEHTRKVHVLDEGEIAVLTPRHARFISASGRPRSVAPVSVDWDDDVVEKGGYETFMLKEIYEQREAVADTLASWIELERQMPAIGVAPEQLRRTSRIVIIGCGTSYHAALAGRVALERWARVPVETDLASEFRHRDPLLAEDSLVIGVTQSGETADTLAAMRVARARGATVLALTNIPGSQATRDADGVLLTKAGIEIGVAATKTFVAQVAALYALALRIAQLRGTLALERLKQLSGELALLPEQIDTVLASVQRPVAELAERLADCDFFLYLGRLSGLAVALEGALKLKEVSYIPTDAYAAGEMKHGPIALLGEHTPVVCVATDADVLDKMLSNISEVRARGARVFAIATEGSKEVAEHAERVVYIPDTDVLLQTILAIIPLQLLAYHIARARALNVDQPRNLAKTVTVE